MDSGNSSSMQSSSGREDEYDSRATVESVSALLFNNNPSSLVNPMANQPPQQLPQPPLPTPMFDPLLNYFDPLSSRSMSFGNHKSLLNFDMGWSENQRSESRTQMQIPVDADSGRPRSSTVNFPSMQIPMEPEPISKGQSNNNNNNNNINMVKNRKKRSRASIRAPTTVLTTDTTNFRAMVQEFTGIPAPPFASTPFPRTRFDLFATHRSSSSSSTSHLDPSLPSYLLRPYAHKHQPPPPPPPFYPTVNTSIPTSINYQLPSDLTFLKQQQLQQQHRNLLTMQNPVLNFQSILQQSSKYMQPNSSINVPSEPEPSKNIDNNQPLKMGVLEDFNLGHGSLSNIVSNPDRTLPRNNDNVSNWVDGVGSIMQTSSNGEKGTENIPTRNGGMVESWICSSD